MATERTLSIVKPDAVARQAVGDIVAMLEKGGLRVVAGKTIRLSFAQAAAFYHVHRERPFFQDLVSFMTSGPVFVQVLEGEGAIAKNRELMGPTDSKKAPPGTIRGRFGTDIERNACHGSDAPETAAFEIGYFFSGLELTL
jgi:nucleoside-diphosphate kinase